MSEDTTNYEIDVDATEDWLKVDVITYQPTKSVFIRDNENPPRTIGVETCYEIVSANLETCLADVEIHVNMKTEDGVGLTSSTGKPNGSEGRIALDLTCTSTNEPTNAKTPVPTTSTTNNGGSGTTNQPTSAPSPAPSKAPTPAPSTKDPTQSPTDPPTEPVSYLITLDILLSLLR